MGIGRFYVYSPQVLTGETPFRGIRQSALALHVLRGVRPDKPENASAIGLCDSLWDLTRRCWDGKMELRPEVGEVVAQLGKAAASWDGIMPPCTHGEGVASGPEEMSDSEEYSELENLILLWYCLFSNGPGAVFQPPSGGVDIQRGGLYETWMCYLLVGFLLVSWVGRIWSGMFR